MLRTRARRAKGRPIDESLGEAVERLAAVTDRAGLEARLRTVEVHPVLTAHPTEARRRTLLVALRRIRRLLDSLDDPLTTPDEDADLRRRLREEITLLWHTGDLRAVLPTPLDEVRSALAIFDETLFTVVPRYVRALDRALDSVAAGGGRAADDAPPALAVDAGRTGTRPVAAPSLLRFGSWIGSDRDGHPGVTAEITLHAARLQADHLLRGYEAVASRLMQTVAARVAPERVDRALDHALALDAEELPETMRQLRRRFPEEPYRQRLGAIAERLRRTRAAMTGEPGARARRLRRRRGARRGAGLAPARAGRGRARAGWPGARSPSCAGSWGRSGSTSPRSRSASTPRPIGPRSRPSGRAPGRTPRSRPGSRWPRSWRRSGRSRASRRGSASRRAGGT